MTEVDEWLNKHATEAAREKIQSEEGQRWLREDSIVESLKDKTGEELKSLIKESTSGKNIAEILGKGKGEEVNLIADLAKEKGISIEEAEKIIRDVIENAIFVVVFEEIQENEQGS